MKLPIEELFHEGFYGESSKKFEEHRKQQIISGFNEYTIAYNPNNFTPDEQMEHFMSELPDILHYGYGMYVTMKKLEKENWELKTKVEELLAEMHRREMWKDEK